ncbi:MAG: secretion system protein E [Ideonella sp. MAG2]|nr:MAG: secretion system protein E [Ideonella sp. MAG2]
MMNIELTRPDGQTSTIAVADDCIIGKGNECDLRLNNWRIGREHARLFNTPSGVFIEDLGAFGGVQVNDQRIDLQHGPLSVSDRIVIGPFRIKLLASAQEAMPWQAPADSMASTRRLSRRASDHLHGNQLTPEDLRGAAEYGRRAQDQSLRGMPGAAQGHAVAPAAASAVAHMPAAHSVEFATPAPSVRVEPSNSPLKLLEFEWRKRLHGLLIESMDLRRRDVSSMTDERLRSEAASLMDGVMQSVADEIPSQLNPTLLRKQVIDEAVGLGPLEELLIDDSISEIMVNRYDSIYVERRGQLHPYPLSFTSDKAVISVIERIVAPLGRHIDESSPMVDARLKDGSRVNAIIPPLAIHGSAITIRKFPKRKLTGDDLVNLGSISPEMLRFLKVCVESRKNIIISGGTGSGKTSLLNILSNFIPDSERVITVEDAAELKLHHHHLISLEARPPNAEGKGAVAIRDLVKNVLRMRPDRVVIGECRGAEALDMLQAMNTGHEGSLTTLHANTPRDALARLETMILMAGADLPLPAIREQIASAVDIIVQQTRFACGTRAITHITEISGMESGRFQMQDLFLFMQRGYYPEGHPKAGKVRGYFTGCDVIPSFYEDLNARGGALDLRLFSPASEEQALSQHAAPSYVEPVPETST